MDIAVICLNVLHTKEQDFAETRRNLDVAEEWNIKVTTLLKYPF